MVDAPLAGANGPTWLIDELQGEFTLVGFGDVQLPDVPGIRRIGVNQRADYPCFSAERGHATRRYGSDIAYLFRPDGHVCAVFRKPDVADVQDAIDTAMGRKLEVEA
jgi:3-(3-hydroxy-phenyl)propionate hydroxylase